MDLELIKKLARKRHYRLTLHAEVERDADEILVHEIQEVLLSQEAEIIEDYPNDPRGPSCLVLGFTKEGRSLHAVCGIVETDMLIIITVYHPDPHEWIDWRIRKEKKP